MKNISKSLVGIAGAHFVAAELSQLGFVATVTSRNTEGIDILACSPDGSKTVSIQVKTSAANYANRSWIMSSKCEGISVPNLFYVFVDLNDKDKKPDFYVVPSEQVAHYVKADNKEYIETPSKRTGKKHKETDFRIYDELKDDNAKAKKYKSNWNLLGL